MGLLIKTGYFLSRWPPCNVAGGVRQLSAASLVRQMEAQDPLSSITQYSIRDLGEDVLSASPES